ncbi:MAG: SLBB domain-containing protein [bacterium]
MRYLYLFLILSGIIFAQDDEKNSNGNSSLFPSVDLISVTIGGNFIVTGSFTASVYQRLDHFITTVFNQTKEASLARLTDPELIYRAQKELDSYPFRNITLKRTNGQVLNIDLIKFRLLGDFKFNPYLMSDDIIIFPSYDPEYDFIEITGAVNKYTKFQFVQGDKLSDALLFAGGVSQAFDNVDIVEISRLDNSGSHEEIVRVKVSEDFELKSGDRIRVLADENHKKEFKILVIGEVKYPGYVNTTRTGEKLRKIIEKAGGFTGDADLYRAEVLRNFDSKELLKKYSIMEEYTDNPIRFISAETQLKLNQLREDLALKRGFNLEYEDTTAFGIDSQLKILGGEHLVDFTKLSDADSEDSNFMIEDGDIIIIPQKFEYIYVFGQANKTGYVKYEAGKDYNFYIRKAGGKSEMAKEEEEEIVIIKGRNKNWISEGKEKVIIEPGDMIYIPKQVPKDFYYYLSRIGSIMGIVGSVATLILLMIQIGK